ncbi:hypothetical protein BHM03_00030596, partial [Ensete ventricosum]
ANVLGKPKTDADFLPYGGDGFKLLIPSKWDASKEVRRFEDNLESNSNVNVVITPASKKSVSDSGSPDDFLSQVNQIHLLKIDDTGLTVCSENRLTSRR